METTSENLDLARSELKPGSRKFGFADFSAVAALVVALIAPAFELNYSMRVEQLSILQGCWELHSESLIGVCIGLLILPIIYLIVNRRLTNNARAYWVLCLAGIVSLGAYWGIIGEATLTLRTFSGAFPIYAVFCLGGVLVSIIKDVRWHAPISNAILSIAAFLCFYTLPFLSTNDCFLLTGSQILEISSDSYDVWPKAFLFCPWIAAILALSLRSRAGRIVSAVVLLLPWLVFLSDAPENWEFTRAMGLYTLCMICVGATVFCGATNPDTTSAPRSDEVPKQVADTDETGIFGFQGLGAVSTGVAILLTIQCVISFAPVIVLMLCTVGYCAIIYYFRTQLTLLPLISIGGIIVSDIILMILLFVQQEYIASGDYEALQSLNIKYMLDRLLLIISVIGVVAKPQELKRISVVTYLAIPVMLFFFNGLIFAHSLGLMEIDESFPSTVSTISTIESILLVLVTLALVYLNRNNAEESTSSY